MFQAKTLVLIYTAALGAALASAQYGDEFLAPRIRRQITYPPPQAPPQAPPNAGNNGMFGFLSDLGPQVERVKQFSSIFSSVSGQQQPQQPGLVGSGNPLQSSPGSSATQLLTQLGDLMRSSQTGGQQAVQQGLAAAQNTQTGLQAALSEMIQGVQRIALNNPMLLPEVKNLFQSVSSRLSSTANQQAPNNNQIVPAKNADQLVDNLTKVALMPQSA